MVQRVREFPNCDGCDRQAKEFRNKMFLDCFRALRSCSVIPAAARGIVSVPLVRRARLAAAIAELSLKCQNGDCPSRIFEDLNSAISRNQAFVWYQMINRTGSTLLSAPPGFPRVIRTKNRSKRQTSMSSRELALKLDVSRTTVGHIVKEDLGCHVYKNRIERMIVDVQKEKRKKFANWIRYNLNKRTNFEICLLRREMIGY